MEVLVTVLHLGETYSFYAFSYRNKPIEMRTGRHWETTSLLIDENEQFYAFGNQAEEHYFELVERNEHKRWRMFRRFKTNMKRTTGVPSQFLVEDSEGRSYSALQIFAIAIKYLKDTLLKPVKDWLDEDWLRFVLTVPDAWGEDGKQFTKRTAIQAGINSDRLDVVYESEAIAIWCYIANGNDGRKLQMPDHTFMVINQKGNIMDITVNQIQSNGSLKIIYHELFTSIGVLQLFVDHFEKVFGKGVLEYLHRSQPKEYFELIDAFSRKDIHINRDEDIHENRDKCVVSMYVSPRLREGIHSQCTSDINAHFTGDKLRIDMGDLRIPLEWHVRRFVDHIVEVMNQPHLKEIQSVILVCDHAIVENFQDKFKKIMPGMNVFTTANANSAFLSGALLFGHKSASISRNRTKNGRASLPPNVISRKTVISNSNIPRSKFLVVAAFDFGTTYSGYAYSYENEADTIKANKPWHSNDSSASLSSLKTPTSLLLDPKGKFHSFGFEAEDHFSLLVEENGHTGWRLFRRFKMILYKNKNLSRYMYVEDIEGTYFPAITIFAMSIKYLNEHLLKTIALQTSGIKESDIQIVLTVPAIWEVGATQFMREAAEQAGINSERLMLAFESEVAALWCALHYKRDFQQLIGSKYIVIDLGGGTADITVHERPSDNVIKLIHQPSGGPWGGVNVDVQFFQYLEKALGNGVLQELRKKNLDDYYTLMRTFENKKRADSIVSARFTTFQLPQALLQIAKDKGKESSHSGGTIADKIRIDSATVKGWFDSVVVPLIDHINSLMKINIIADVQTIMLVGGFAESTYVQKSLQEALKGKQLIVPPDAGLAVVKGAVIFGHNPQIFSSRVLKYTYGIEVYDDFDENIHSKENLVFANGKWKVDNCFHIFVRANELIPVNHCVTHFITPLAQVSVIAVYKSYSENPKYTTEDGCTWIGTLMIENNEDIPLQKQEKEVTFMFGNTEIFVNVKHTETGREERLILDCL